MRTQLFFIFLLLGLSIVTSMPSTDVDDLVEQIARYLDGPNSGEEKVDKREVGTTELGVTPLVQRGLQVPPLKIAAFNIQVFGLTKYGKDAVRETLVKILKRYDLILVQEIRDSSDTAFPKLAANLNGATDGAYEYVASGRLGRTNSKEQYAYLYRTARVKILDTYTFNDVHDLFEREPFCIHVASLDAVVQEFVVIGIHTKPSAAEQEIGDLVKVYDDVTERFGTKDAILMGDFNAGCSYVTQSEWEKVALKTDTRFTWFIGDDLDTTVSNSDCPYDRIVVGGQALKAGYVPNSAKIFDFKTEFGLTLEEAKLVSDHYPIEMRIYGNLSNLVIKSHAKVSFSVPSSTPAGSNPLSLLQGSLSGGASFAAGFSITLVSVSKEVEKSAVKAASEVDCSDIVGKLDEFRSKHPKMMSNTEVGLVATYLNSGVLTAAPPVPGIMQMHEPTHRCTVEIVYKLMEPFSYSVTVTKTVR